MLFSEIIIIYFIIQNPHIQCVGKKTIFNVKAGNTYSYHCALKG
jgi:hypothetical protein